RCKTPCSLDLPPGPVRVDVANPHPFTRDLTVPSRGATLSVNHRAVSTYVVGAVLTGLAIASLGAAIGLGVNQSPVYGYGFGGTSLALGGLATACFFLGGSDR